MDKEKLAELNIGQNLDNLMNLDPRGYGVCRILYKASREYTGEPLVMNAAKKLIKTVHEGDLVYILTGFVLMPHKKAEMDGICSAIALARTIAYAFGAVPVMVVPEDNVEAIKNLAPVVGLHAYDDIEEARKYPASVAYTVFTKDLSKARKNAEDILSSGMPSAVVSIEAPGSNKVGVFHNAIGKNLTDLEAKSEVLFEMLREKGVLNIAIGDLGNEIGMATIKDHIDKYVPYAGEGRCSCGCGGGLATTVATDNIITATVSDWGAYGMMAAMAYLLEDYDVMPDGKMVREIIETASNSGMLDMYGWLLPAVDGFDVDMNVLIVELMRKCIVYKKKVESKTTEWYKNVLELEFYDKVGL